MRKIVFLIVISAFIATILGNGLFADDTIPGSVPKDVHDEWKINNPNTLPIWLTPEELKLLPTIGANIRGSTPPSGLKRNVAEFEPQEAVLIRYSFGISYAVIKEMAEDTEVVTIVSSTSTMNSVISKYQQNSVNLNNCSFLIASSNSFWTRDYGPWFIFDDDDDQAIIDMIYNRPRPLDDAIPTKYGQKNSIPVFDMDLITAGGNYMTDGHGISVSTDLIIKENSSMTKLQIQQMVDDYMSIKTYHMVDDALHQYIEHIDCWAKFIAPDKIMIIEVPPSSSIYNDLENAVKYFESQPSCYGWPYKAYRVYTPNGQPYVNGLVLNKKVLVPQTGSSWDDDALDSFEAAMPGYEVLGFTGSWQTTDALHCRTKGIADSNMLYLHHTPLQDCAPSAQGFYVESEVLIHSNGTFVNNTPELIWQVNGGGWNTVPMTYTGTGNDYSAYIPSAIYRDKIEYYIHAEDSTGKSENHPYIGLDGAHSFTVEAHFLTTDVSTISESAGGVVNFTLDAGTANGARKYIMLGSLTGTAPGLPLPGGIVNLPVNWDILTDVVVAMLNTPVFEDFLGTLNASGVASSKMDSMGPLPSGSIGAHLYFAFALSNPWDFASNPADIEIVF